MITRLIPPLELAWTRGFPKGSEIIKELSSVIEDLQEIKKLQDQGNPNGKKLTITYSIPRPGSTFNFRYVHKTAGELVDEIKAVDIDTGYTNGDISLEDVHSTFQKAFNYYIALFKEEVPGLEIELKQLSSGYENMPRPISYDPMNTVPVNDVRYKAGDIKLIFADFYPNNRLAYAYKQYNPKGPSSTPLGVKSNAGMTILFNTNVDFRRNDDPALFAYPQIGINDISLDRYSLLTVMIHEIGHLFGVGHFPTAKNNILPSIMNGSIRSSVSLEHVFPNRLWSDYWLRAALAELYKYPLNHIVAGQEGGTDDSNQPVPAAS